MNAQQVLARVLEQHGFEVRYDQNSIRMGEKLSSGILDLLDWADVVVSLIDQNSINSKAVLEELTRAHDRYLRIIPIVQDQLLPELPWFLTVPRLLTYSADQDLQLKFASLCQELDKARDDLIRDRLHKKTRKQHELLPTVRRLDEVPAGELALKLELSSAIIENCNEELDGLQDGRFEASVSLGANFLLRANPVFRNAAQILATSLDSVSTFWTSPDIGDQDTAIDYLLSHPARTRRLFVFSTPDVAHHYSTVLNFHHLRYGSTGGVYLCSEESYRKALQPALLARDGSEILDRDFALLDYEGDGRTNTMSASLDGQAFSLSRSWKRELGISPDYLRKFFDDLSGLSHGDIWEPRDECQVMRWRHNIHLDSPQEWSDCLRGLFTERMADSYHLVFFSQEAFSESLSKKVMAIKHKLERLTERDRRSMKLKDLWVGQTHAVDARDHTYRGRILNMQSDQYPIVLMMRFDDAESLKHWYELNHHAPIRREIFEEFDVEIRELYRQIDVILARNPRSLEIADLYERIETKAGNFMHRRDYVDSQLFEDIVRLKPWRPKRRYKIPQAVETHLRAT